MRIQSKKKYSLPIRLLFRLQKKKYKKVLSPLKVWGRIPKVYFGFLKMYQGLNSKKAALKPNLRALLFLYVSRLRECPFCEDRNLYYFLKTPKGKEKYGQIGEFEKSSLFSSKEKMALRYANLLIDNKVDDAFFAELKKQFSEQEIVELTALILVQDMSSRFNVAFGIESAGFCSLN